MISGFARKGHVLGAARWMVLVVPERCRCRSAVMVTAVILNLPSLHQARDKPAEEQI